MALIVGNVDSKLGVDGAARLFRGKSPRGRYFDLGCGHHQNHLDSSLGLAPDLCPYR